MFAISIVWWKCAVRKNLVSSKVFYGMLGYKIGVGAASYYIEAN